MTASRETVRELQPYGFYFEDSEEEPVIFLIMVEGHDEDRPLMSAGRVILFGRTTEADQAIALDDEAGLAALVGPATFDLNNTYLFDIPAVLRVIREDDRDDSALLLDFLNLVLDVVNAIGAPLPTEYRATLHGLADHMTFEREFGAFIESAEIGRERVRDALFWCFEAIVVNSIFVRPG